MTVVSCDCLVQVVGDGDQIINPIKQVEIQQGIRIKLLVQYSVCSVFSNPYSATAY